ncbi:unnamed protein product [Bursaphelenchus okinawaensis]|uniref:Uncharacterized protein n=1 Tax=Bursaphelenchus okinawaensis TaxID=465554 RepID=A0A811L6Q6_9BILA|nr:unnamed protein product [Bursaphelenchus okinawaensis]CAG9116847.1 unnamed protein product [Bursaphelenchus okinawaensis]
MKITVILLLFVLLVSQVEARSRLKKYDESLRAAHMGSRVKRYDTILGVAPKRIRRMTKEGKVRSDGVA